MQPELPSRVRDLAPPSECGLLEWLRVRVTRLMLEEISRNDYEDQSAEHLAAIFAQLGAKPPLGMLPWCPLEVLELERWTTPDCEREHIKRLFACTILVRNAGYIPDGSGTDFTAQSATTLLRLADSAIALDHRLRVTPRRQRGHVRRRERREDVSLLALRFLLWVLDRQPDPEFRPFASFCVLLLAVHIGLGDPSGEDLLELCRWVEDEETKSRETLGYKVHSERWLIGLSSYEDHKGERDRWVDSASRILGRLGPEHTVAVQTALTRLSHRIAAL
jgi:hypothetical protein